MTEFKLSTYLIGIVLFSLMVGALSFVYGDLGSTYEITIDNKYNKTYNKISAVENSTLEIGDRIKKDAGTFDTFVLAGKTILQAPRIVFDSLKTSTQLITEATADFGIPSIFSTAALTILTILIVFAIVSLWARWKT
ncbi:hypothetical protein CMI37_14635 [Candidatus Pacearchaeota archaeon]|nr:hypothetical protein [Candidatus Pacearchaeota archaeon]|tara:strand:+ start:3807 stop:4217 length:411 start_codon:yes stop_codon:yes gene_type:complete